ncbi:helicase associated domain-containing protein [Streptomyces microflavus]|uniref:helicase associated domain-containing protein n=1 Tax=Streptomyces microflavus TaxID=1919 RepID=UPI003B20C53A
MKPAQRVAAAAAGQGRREDVSSLRAGRGRPSRSTSAREGHQRVPGTHAEAIAVEGETTRVVVKLGVWISNTKSRRGKLTADQRGALTELGVEWA